MALGVVALAGCYEMYPPTAFVFTPSRPALPPRAVPCDFAVLTERPQAPFVELGAIDAKLEFGHRGVQTAAEFKAEVSQLVCSAGGDAVLASQGASGFYLKAAVIKFTDASAATRPVAGVDPRPSGGCQFDTQCKGDRVCVHGECVSPTTSASTAQSDAGF
jgi:hypothetical protein